MPYVSPQAPPGPDALGPAPHGKYGALGLTTRRTHTPHSAHHHRPANGAVEVGATATGSGALRPTASGGTERPAGDATARGGLPPRSPALARSRLAAGILSAAQPSSTASRDGSHSRGPLDGSDGAAGRPSGCLHQRVSSDTAALAASGLLDPASPAASAGGRARGAAGGVRSGRHGRSLSVGDGDDSLLLADVVPLPLAPRKNVVGATATAADSAAAAATRGIRELAVHAAHKELYPPGRVLWIVTEDAACLPPPGAGEGAGQGTRAEGGGGGNGGVPRPCDRTMSDTGAASGSGLGALRAASGALARSATDLEPTDGDGPGGRRRRSSGGGGGGGGGGGLLGMMAGFVKAGATTLWGAAKDVVSGGGGGGGSSNGSGGIASGNSNGGARSSDDRSRSRSVDGRAPSSSRSDSAAVLQGGSGGGAGGNGNGGDGGNGGSGGGAGGNGSQFVFMLEADRCVFDRLVLVPSCVTDHLPDAYMQRLRQLARGRERERAQGAAAGAGTAKTAGAS